MEPVKRKQHKRGKRKFRWEVIFRFLPNEIKENGKNGRKKQVARDYNLLNLI